MSVEPRGFPRQLYEALHGDAQQLGGLTFSEADDRAYDEIDEVVSTLTDRADRVDDLLRTSGTSTFAVLSATLSTNYARKIHRLRQIQDQFGERLPSVVIVAIGLYILTSLSGAAVPGPYLHIIVPAITTVGLLPIVASFAFVLRIATVSQRTAATLPFTTSSQEQ